MQYAPDCGRICGRFEEYWARENHDRPLLCIRAPKAGRTAPPPSAHATHGERWLDTEYVLERARHDFESTCFVGEALPMLNPNLGPDAFAAFYGTPLEFGANTSWALHNLDSLEDCAGLALQRQGFYYQKMLELTRAAVEDGKDRYFVGITDLHAGLDGLVSMRGPERLCMDTIENAQWVRQASLALFDGFRQVVDELYALTTAYQQGSVNWMGAWHPGKWYPTSCDFCCMISKDMFEDFVLPELLQELDYLDASIFHLDGPGALRHLDRLLQIPRLRGVQWVYGAGQPTAAHWVETLQKIQRAGKCMHVGAVPEDLPALLEQVPPEGVLYQINARSEEEAGALLRMAETRPRRVF